MVITMECNRRGAEKREARAEDKLLDLESGGMTIMLKDSTDE